MQVGYFTREDNSNAKAGNMNNAFFQTKGKFIAVFDADFFAFPEFLNRTVGFFYDPKIGAVQTPHHFYNNDPLEYNIGLYNEIGDEQRLWFDDILEARDSFNLATSCGSSSIVRRAALEEIGGFPIDTITEDYDMSIRFMENGLVTRYLNERLSVGLAAEDLDGFFTQRKRWARGNIQVWNLHFKRKKYFNFLTYIFLFDWYYAVQIPSRVFISFVPLFFLYFGLYPLIVDNFISLAIMYWTFLFLNIASLNTLTSNKFVPLVTNAINYICSIKIVSTVASSFIKPFGQPFKVTPKGVKTTQKSKESRRLLLFLNTMIILLVGGSIWALTSIDSTEDYLLVIVPVYWALITAASFIFSRLMVKERPRQRHEERFKSKQLDAYLYNSTIKKKKYIYTHDISLGGISVEGNIADDFDIVSINGISIPIVKIGNYKGSKNTIFVFKDLSIEDEEQLTISIFNDNFIPKRKSMLFSLIKAFRKLV